MKSIVKKLLSLAVCVALLTGILNFGILAEGELTVSLSARKNDDGNVELTVSLENNNDATVNLEAKIQYDKAKLTLSQAEALTGNGDDTFNKSGSEYVALTVEGFAGNGTLAKAVFKIKDDVEGEAKFVFSSLKANDGITVTGSPASINIEKKAETKIELDKTDLEIKVGENGKITATVTPDGTEITWSSSATDVATVDDSGNVTGIGAGEAVITAKAADGTEAKCNVKVTAQPTEPKTIEVDDISVTVDEEKSLNYTLPEGVTGDVKFTSDDEKIAKVDSDGKVKGVSAGETNITVECGEYKGTCKVTVTAASVELKGIKLDYSTLTLESGERQNLKVSAEPAGATIDESKLKWSSSKTDIATVSDEGRVRAKTKVSGKTVITVKYGEFEAKCEVEVVYIPATGVTLEKEECEIEIGDTSIIKATVTPSDSHDIPEYSSSDEKVATVSSKGKVTAVSEGEATITVTVGKFTFEYKVKVVTPAADERLEGVTISDENLELKVGEQYKLTYTTVPETIENFELTPKWSSGNDEIVEVDAEGNVTAKKAGMTTITLWLGTKKSECTVKVNDNDAVTTATPDTVTNVPTTTTDDGLDTQTQAVAEPSGSNGIFKVILVAIIILVVMFIALTVLYFVQKKRAADYEDDDDDYYDDDDDDDDI